MKLLDDIIASVTETREGVPDILRRCLVLAHKLKIDTLKVWVEKELNGYKLDDDLPDYRRGNGTAVGHFSGPFGAGIKNQPLASSILDEEFRSFANEINLYEPIASYDGADKNSTYKMQWPADLVARYQSSFIRGYALNSAWMPIPGAMMAGLVDIIRTRILTFALDIQSELPEDQAETVEALAPGKIESMVQNIFYGNNNYVGDNGVINAPTINVGDLESLKRALATLGMEPPDVEALEKALVDDKDQLGIGAKTATWIGAMSMKGLAMGTKYADAIGAGVLANYVSRYLGI